MLPLLYLGGTHAIPALTVIGFVIVTTGMLAVPVLRFLPAPDEKTVASRSPEQG